VPTRSPGVFVASAVAVELAALVVGTTRRVRFAIVAGVAVSTIGFAGEYAWSQGAAQPWRPALVRDALLVGSLAAVGAAVLAVGYARAAGRLPGRPLGRGIALAAAAAVVVALLLPLPRRAPGGVVAAMELRPVGDGTAEVDVTLTPADAAHDARWFQVMAWQGDGYDVAELDEVAPGHFVTDHPVPIVDRWKTVLRLHRGAELLAAPVYLPADPDIGAVEVPAQDRTVELGDETSLLLREVREGPATTGAIAYTVIGLVVAAWVGSFAIAIRRIADAPRSGSGARRFGDDVLRFDDDQRADGGSGPTAGPTGGRTARAARTQANDEDDGRPGRAPRPARRRDRWFGRRPGRPRRHPVGA